VDLIQVDVVGLQAAQAVLAGRDDVVRREVLAAVADPGGAARGAGDLGGQHQAFACARTAGEPVAEDALGGAVGLGTCGHRIHLGRVDEVDAAFERAVEDGKGGGLVDLFAEGHGAQADRGDVQVAAAQLDQGKIRHRFYP